MMENNLMPQYNYRCLTCEKEFELQRSYDDNSKPRCPHCKSRKVQHLIESPAVIYRGKDFTLSNDEGES